MAGCACGSWSRRPPVRAPTYVWIPTWGGRVHWVRAFPLICRVVHRSLRLCEGVGTGGPPGWALRRTLTDHKGAVESVLCVHDALVTAGADGALRVYR
jgi:hypothetical protein